MLSPKRFGKVQSKPLLQNAVHTTRLKFLHYLSTFSASSTNDVTMAVAEYESVKRRIKLIWRCSSSRKPLSVFLRLTSAAENNAAASARTETLWRDEDRGSGCHDRNSDNVISIWYISCESSTYSVSDSKADWAENREHDRVFTFSWVITLNLFVAFHASKPFRGVRVHLKWNSFFFFLILWFWRNGSSTFLRNSSLAICACAHENPFWRSEVMRRFHRCQ